MHVENVIKKLAHRPESYFVSRTVFNLLKRKENKAFKLWVNFLLKTYEEAFKKKKPVIWINAFTPSEIVYGLGGTPALPEIIAAIVAYLGQSRRFISAADTYLSTDTCSFYRCVLGLALEGYLTKPDLIISSSHLCDGANKFFKYLAQLYDCPHLFLDPPYWSDEKGRKYLVSQVDEVLKSASKIIGIPLSDERLGKAVELSNEARKYIEKTNELRRVVPSPFSARDGISYFAGMNFHSLGSEAGVEFQRTLYEEIKQRVEHKEGYLPEEKCRLLWLHHIRPYYKNEIFDIFDEAGAAVPFEEMNYLYWKPLDSACPVKSIADKMLSSIWAGPLERRSGAVLKMVEDYKIDGVVHFSHWGCRQSCGGAGVIGDILKERGMPYIILPGDGTDPQNYSPGQTRTRLEAFLEMLL